MKPAPFDLLRPATLPEAVALIVAHKGEARLLAGGQSLVPMLNTRMISPGLLIDLNRIDELSGVAVEGSCLRIGAMTRQRQLLADPLIAVHAPLLKLACSHVGHVQTRARGTIGGSMAHADPSAELAVACVALNALLVMQSAQGERQVSAREFFVAALITGLGEDEILTSILIPIPAEAPVIFFEEYARRHGDFAIGSVAGQRVGSRIDIALGALQPTPHYCEDIGSAAASRSLTPARMDDLVGQEIAALDPMEDIQASAAYRRKIGALLLRNCMRAMSV